VKVNEEPQPICTYLHWDSEFFGHKIGRANQRHLDHRSISKLLSWCVENRIECVYLLADSDDPQTSRLVEANEFLLADVRITLERALDQPPAALTSAIVRPACEGDLEALRAIARTVHRDTRFYFDGHFDRAKCDQFYETWIEKSVRGYARAVFVAEVDGEPVAYITGDLRGDEAQIGLLGVADGYRGASLGSTLLQHFLSWAAKEGAKRAIVITQGRNLRAQRLYQRCGFVSAACQLWYHRWFLE
jgi:dTDP-4-amino-4,6-dideoxy-D-galactose acyltransferase